MTDTEREALYARIDELCQEVEKYRSARDASADLAAKTINRIRELEAEAEQLRAANAAFTGRSLRAGDKMACLEAENAKLRELLQRLHKEYQYMKVRPRQMYLQHEQRMRSIEDEMRELGIEVNA